LFAGRAGHVVVGAGTTWTSYAVAAAFVSAVTAGDAFATNGAVPTHVVHFDGTRWSPINVDPTRYYFAVAASASDLFAYGTQRISVPVPVLESFVRVP
jgi:hypothetical protein